MAFDESRSTLIWFDVVYFVLIEVRAQSKRCRDLPAPHPNGRRGAAYAHAQEVAKREVATETFERDLGLIQRGIGERVTCHDIVPQVHAPLLVPTHVNLGELIDEMRDHVSNRQEAADERSTRRVLLGVGNGVDCSKDDAPTRPEGTLVDLDRGVGFIARSVREVFA